MYLECIFLFLHKNICCGYSLEVPHQGTSNEYPEHMFSCRNKKNIDSFQLKKSALSYDIHFVPFFSDWSYTSRVLNVALYTITDFTIKISIQRP